MFTFTAESGKIEKPNIHKNKEPTTYGIKKKGLEAQ